MTAQPRLAVLASGRGSNLAAIADACARGEVPAELVLVISNVDGAGVLQQAAQRAIPTRCIPHRAFADRESFEAALLETLREHRVGFVALAGFMRILTPAFIGHYYGSLLNIHPSLLPNYPGLHTHRQVLAAGDSETGATVHFVTPELDAGPAVMSARVPVLPGDDESSLAARVREAEHRIYPRALTLCLSGRVTLRDGVAFKDGEPLGEGGVHSANGSEEMAP